MPIRNPSFTEAGTEPGLARDWRLVSLVRDQRVVGFGPAPHRGVEDFERWSTFRAALEQTERAFFDARPEGYEDFSDGFATDTFAWIFEDTANERATFGAATREAFAPGFANAVFAVRWPQVNSAAAQFGGASVESFSRGFKNDQFAWTLMQAPTAAALFGSRRAETFETTWPEHDARGGDLHG